MTLTPFQLFPSSGGKVLITLDSIIVAICCSIVLANYLGWVGAAIVVVWVLSFVYTIYANWSTSIADRPTDPKGKYL